MTQEYEFFKDFAGVTKSDLEMFKCGGKKKILKGQRGIHTKVSKKTRGDNEYRLPGDNNYRKPGDENASDSIDFSEGNLKGMLIRTPGPNGNTVVKKIGNKTYPSSDAEFEEARKRTPQARLEQKEYEAREKARKMLNTATSGFRRTIKSMKK